MSNILERIKAHYSKKSKLYIVSDVAFYLFILLLIIPTTRTPVITFVKKLTLTAPLSIKAPEGPGLTEKDYQWSLSSAKGEVVSLKEMQGKVVFLNFWATWCAPCRAEMPSMQELFEEYGDKLEFVLVSNEEQEVTTRFLEENGYTMPSYSQISAVPDAFSSGSIPTTFIIAPGGKIILKKKGTAKWDSRKIKKLLDTYLN